MFSPCCAFFLSVCFALCGCSLTKSNRPKSSDVSRVDSVEVMDSRDWGKPDWGELLTELNRGELLRLDGHYDRSTTAFTRADMMIGAQDARQSQATVSLASLTDYQPSDFERVMISNRLALNYVGTGDWNLALALLQRNHKWFEPASKGSEGNGGKFTKFQIDPSAAMRKSSYPFETLNDKAAIALSSNYQTPLSYYTAGFLLEAQGAPLQAAQAYRAAMDLRPEIEILRKGFLGLQERAFISDRKAKLDGADVLFIVDEGSSPDRTIGTIPLLAATLAGPLKVVVGYPAVREQNVGEPAVKLRIGDSNYPLQEVVNFRDLTLRSLRDSLAPAMTSIISRAVANDEERQSRKRSIAAAGTGVTLVATSVASKTDVRAWTTLPSRVSLFRIRLPLGHHQISLTNNNITFGVDITSQFAVVQLREYKGQTYFGSAAQPKVQIAFENSSNVTPARKTLKD